MPNRWIDPCVGTGSFTLLSVMVVSSGAVTTKTCGSSWSGTQHGTPAHVTTAHTLLADRKVFFNTIEFPAEGDAPPALSVQSLNVIALFTLVSRVTPSASTYV